MQTSFLRSVGVVDTRKHGNSLRYKISWYFDAFHHILSQNLNLLSNRFRWLARHACVLGTTKVSDHECPRFCMFSFWLCNLWNLWCKVTDLWMSLKESYNLLHSCSDFLTSFTFKFLWRLTTGSHSLSVEGTVPYVFQNHFSAVFDIMTHFPWNTVPSVCPNVLFRLNRRLLPNDELFQRLRLDNFVRK